jgi:hypothetical protein
MDLQAALAYVGSAVVFLWGIGHLMPTRGIVEGFGDVGHDNRMIINMEWIIEGVTLCFLGVLVAVTASILGPGNAATSLVTRLGALMLLVLAAISAFTGARTSVLPMKLCPIMKSVVALVFLLSTLV